MIFNDHCSSLYFIVVQVPDSIGGRLLIFVLTESITLRLPISSWHVERSETAILFEEIDDLSFSPLLWNLSQIQFVGSIIDVVKSVIDSVLINLDLELCRPLLTILVIVRALDFETYAFELDTIKM